MLAPLAAIAAGLIAPAAASAAPCPPGTGFTPSYDSAEGDVKVPLVATHELTMTAQFADRVDRVSLSVPEGVRVLASRGDRMRLIVPVSASLAVTATWSQDSPNPDDPTCTATATTALPITATRPSRAYYLRKAKGTDSSVVFAVVSDPQRGDVSPMEVSLRVAASTRFPPARAKVRKMPVAMRPSELVKYRKHIPQEEFATTPLRCRYYNLICSRNPRISAWATALQYPGRTIRPGRLNGGALLSRVQPFRKIAPYGVMVDAIVGDPFRSPPKAALDLQVRQSGELIGRARVAFHCGPERTRFGETFYRCRAVRKKFG
ncbi:MAG TPA: hypothetical protein VJT68_06360 [Thermoleophilaceae bacterium]|nr:hypothetical protein [Thermoleophilaceae bacterium]